MSIWKPIKTASKEDYDTTKVDLWLQWGAAPSTMGWADSFRVVDCWRHKGKWVHEYRGEITEINADYITHWMPRPDGPRGEQHY